MVSSWPQAISTRRQLPGFSEVIERDECKKAPFEGGLLHAGEPVCKPDSVHAAGGRQRRPSIWTACCQTVSSGLPGIYDGPSIPAWPCSRWGLQAGPVTRATGGLLHHLFTLACVVRPSAVCFLLHFPSGCPAWVLPSTAPCGVRTFLDSAKRIRGRPTGSLPVILGPNGPVCDHPSILQNHRSRCQQGREEAHSRSWRRPKKCLPGK